MRRNYISPEFRYDKVFGTYNMEEESSFFGSKMLEIEDSLFIGNSNLVYNQNEKNEQIGLEQEIDYPIRVYNVTEDKKSNHKLYLDEFQNEFDKNNNAKWILNINLRTILSNFLFSTLKYWRTFEGVTNQMTVNANVDSAIRDYIERNVINRYKFTGIDLYIVPNDLLTKGTFKFVSVWDPTINQEKYKFTKINIELDPKLIDLKILFSQSFAAGKYSFRYYFDLKFEKL